jgi:thioredoxin-dependent peroxiredoxin
MTAVSERTGVTTFQGRPVTLLGTEVAVGDAAPDFTVLANDFTPITLASTGSGVRILSVVPSLDTEVCDLQTRRFHEEAAGLEGVTVLTVSVDLPFAQRRWCGIAGLTGVRTGSDHRDLSFGLAYGAVVAEFRLLARSVFVVDSRDRVVHVEYVPELGQHPRYEAAIRAAADAAS